MKKMLLVLLMIIVAGCAQEQITPTVERVEVEFTDDPVMGTDDAPVTLYAFEDYQCGYCQKFNLEILPELKKNYVDTGKVKFVFKDFPVLEKHPEAQKAAEAALCARNQDKFWEYHDVLFVNKETLSAENYKLWAQELELDEEAFNECLDSGEKAAEVEADRVQGVNLGVSGTPTVFVNGIRLAGLGTYEHYSQAIEGELTS